MNNNNQSQALTIQELALEMLENKAKEIEQLTNLVNNATSDFIKKNYKQLKTLFYCYILKINIMTKEQYEALEAKLKENGYRKCVSHKRGDHAYYKPYGKSEKEEDRSNYQIFFHVYDFRKYTAHTDSDNPFSIQYVLVISRENDEMVEITNISIKTLEEAEAFAIYMFNALKRLEKTK